MKNILTRILITTLVLVGIGSGIWSFIYLNEQDIKSDEAKKIACESKGSVWDGYYCEPKYSWCMRKVRNTFEDLTDTMGASQNNQDTVSKSMREEIDRCLSTNL